MKRKGKDCGRGENILNFGKKGKRKKETPLGH
jgi:hypothetical protein